MTAAQALARLRAAGIELWLDDGGGLRYRAQGSALTAERLAWLRSHKAELIAALGEPDGLVDLYSDLFDGQARTALVSLDPEQARRAVALGAVDRETAAACELLAYRNPDAQALLAIPREQFDGLGILDVFANPAPAAARPPGTVQPCALRTDPCSTTWKKT